MQQDLNILQVDNLSKYFGGLAAVSNCSIKIKKGSITGVIGPNGSGKTTLFNLIAGNLKPSKGNVLFCGENITGIPSYELFSKGLLRTFQIAHEFTNLTVLENLMMVPGNQSGEHLTNALFNPKIVNQEEKKIKQKALEVIDFLNLTQLSQELAGNLSGGQKKLLELGRTMMVDAKLVLLDEVGAGVNRTLLKDIGSAILRLNKEKGYTFCMIEHDMDFISRLCDPVIVMSEGSVLFKGTSDEVKNNEQVIESYLGRGFKTGNGKKIMPFFSGENMTGGYGGADIINSCTINVNKGEIVAILGPNGAGKSTAMKAMLGLLNLKSGKISIDGKDISKLNPQDRVKEGISFVPQTRNVFTGLSVEENLEMGAYLRDERLEEIIEEIYELFPILKEKRFQLVGELSGGQRQQVALGRALMIKPSVLMLDEPTAGVSPIVMDELFDHILKVKKTNVAIIMVEQNAKQALSIADRGYVLVTGENKFSGTGKELLNDPEVRRSFLGG